MASMRADDLARFSDRVRDSATVLDNGEVLWPFYIVVEAINELAASGRVVLGLDAREANDEGLVTEVPISSYEPTGSPNDVEVARQQAVKAVGHAEAITGWQRPLLLVTW